MSIIVDAQVATCNTENYYWHDIEANTSDHQIQSQLLSSVPQECSAGYFIFILFLARFGSNWFASRRWLIHLSKASADGLYRSSLISLSSTTAAIVFRFVWFFNHFLVFWPGLFIKSHYKRLLTVVVLGFGRRAFWTVGCICLFVYQCKWWIKPAEFYHVKYHTWTSEPCSLQQRCQTVIEFQSTKRIAVILSQFGLAEIFCWFNQQKIK